MPVTTEPFIARDVAFETETDNKSLNLQSCLKTSRYCRNYAQLYI